MELADIEVEIMDRKIEIINGFPESQIQNKESNQQGAISTFSSPEPAPINPSPANDSFNNNEDDGMPFNDPVYRRSNSRVAMGAENSHKSSDLGKENRAERGVGSTEQSTGVGEDNSVHTMHSEELLDQEDEKDEDISTCNMILSPEMREKFNEWLAFKAEITSGGYDKLPSAPHSFEDYLEFIEYGAKGNEVQPRKVPAKTHQSPLLGTSPSKGDSGISRPAATQPYQVLDPNTNSFILVKLPPFTPLPPP
ncbi:hypothetical protein RRF57_005132 [Xylaria bambusicola]|uniref:Uncharacterized protein n=1 Tax=Xylaria bambusicola TaxID=326684 RepID=A0AAN7Z4H4_9PEZI